MQKTSKGKCVTCGTKLAGPYCHACGERRYREPPTLLRFMAELLGEAMDADGRIIGTVRTLVLRPGRLTRDYVEGRRKPYLAPASIFIVMNVVFFFVQPFAKLNIFHADLYSQTHLHPYSGWVERRVEKRLVETGMTRAEYAEAYDATSESYARTLIFVQLPLFAIGLALVQLRMRRRFVEHLVFATHFFAALLLFSVVTSLAVWAYWLLGKIEGVSLEVPFILFVLLYSVFALRANYGDGWPGAVGKACLLLIVSGVVINAYRLILFVVVFGTVAPES